MKSFKNKQGGFAVEAAIMVGVLVVGAGWFGTRELKHAVNDIRQENAVKEVGKALATAEKDTGAALALRDQSEEALRNEKAARKEIEKKSVETVRAIQRSSIQGVVAVNQLPESRQKSHLANRFGEIDLAAENLGGVPSPDSAAQWRSVAEQALAGNAQAQASLDSQRQEIARIGDELRDARAAHDAAQKRADDLQAQANAAQNKAASSLKISSKLLNDAKELFAENALLSSLVTILKLALIAVAGIWVLGIFLKSFAMAVPGNGKKPAIMHNVANFFLSLLAPLSVLGEVRARRDTEKLIEGAGSFIADLRENRADVAKAVTDELDIALSPSHQKRIRSVVVQLGKDRAAAAAEVDMLR